MSPEAPRPVRVLIVDDEELTAAAHAAYVGRIDGFEVAGVAHSGRETIRLLRESLDATDAPQASPQSPVPAASPRSIDLLLLDMNLPDTHGLDLGRQIRGAGLTLDIIAITAVRDVSVVRSSVSLGIVQYLIKPFSFATFASRMHGYLEYRQSLGDTAGFATQGDVDRTLAALRTAPPVEHDKGMSEGTLRVVIDALRAATLPVSATEVSERAAISRVTARRYLEYLVSTGTAERRARYGTPGRPEFEYAPSR